MSLEHEHCKAAWRNVAKERDAARARVDFLERDHARYLAEAKVMQDEIERLGDRVKKLEVEKTLRVGR